MRSGGFYFIECATAGYSWFCRTLQNASKHRTQVGLPCHPFEWPAPLLPSLTVSLLVELLIFYPWAVYWSLEGKNKTKTVIDIYPYVLLPLSIPHRYRFLQTHRRVFWGPQKHNPALSGGGRPARPNCPSVAVFRHPFGSRPTKQIWNSLKEDKLECSEELGDLMKQAPADLSHEE